MLVLVVGPSGAGKDTLLGAAKAALAGDPRFRFVRRAITRSADTGGEDHEALSEADFMGRDFALKWQAHGLWYGIPAGIAGDLSEGRTVVANVSRGVIAEAAARFPVRVIEVTAPPDMLAARLVQRGREDEADIAKRLARAVEVPAGTELWRVVNDGTPEEGIRRFLVALDRGSEAKRD
jgi:phosphonate metabolism protein PhnN/1,5-bisphosphokinase (PRPP-forming)